jgi:hypothetical protein
MSKERRLPNHLQTVLANQQGLFLFCLLANDYINFSFTKQRTFIYSRSRLMILFCPCILDFIIYLLLSMRNIAEMFEYVVPQNQTFSFTDIEHFLFSDNLFRQIVSV